MKESQMYEITKKPVDDCITVNGKKDASVKLGCSLFQSFGLSTSYSLIHLLPEHDDLIIGSDLTGRCPGR